MENGFDRDGHSLGDTFNSFMLFMVEACRQELDRLGIVINQMPRLEAAGVVEFARCFCWCLRWAEAPGNVLPFCNLTGLPIDCVANASQGMTLDRSFLVECAEVLPDSLIGRLRIGGVRDRLAAQPIGSVRE